MQEKGHIHVGPMLRNMRFREDLTVETKKERQNRVDDQKQVVRNSGTFDVKMEIFS